MVRASFAKSLDASTSMNYSRRMHDAPMTVVETPSFLRDAKVKLSDGEREELVFFLASKPESGAIIPGTSGLRKLRWARTGEGKRGGYRVVYYYYSDSLPLFVIALYGKNEKADLTQAERNQAAKLIDALRRYGRQT